MLLAKKQQFQKLVKTISGDFYYRLSVAGLNEKGIRKVVMKMHVERRMLEMLEIEQVSKT